MKLHALYWIKVILALPVAILFGVAATLICVVLVVGSCAYVVFHREPGEYDWWNHERDNLDEPWKEKDFREARVRP